MVKPRRRDDTTVVRHRDTEFTENAQRCFGYWVLGEGAGVEITVDTSTCCGGGAAAAEFVARMMAAPPPEAAEGGGQRLRTCSRAKKKAEPGNRIYLG